MFGVLVGDDRFELVDQRGEGGAVGWCVRLCGEAGSEVGFSFAECFEPVTVAADAVLEEIGRDRCVFSDVGW